MENLEIIQSVKKILEWNQDLPVIDHLTAAIRGAKRVGFDSKAAICFDSNIFLHLGKFSNVTELTDYLGSKHQGPIILPSQVLVELWNNHLTGIDDYVSKLEKQFSELNISIARIDPQYSTLTIGASDLVESFKEEYGYVLNDKMRSYLVAFLEMLSLRADISQVPRAEFSRVADIRNRTKTPPGFMDTGDGDFFVWAEFLKGLLAAKLAGRTFDRAILVTDDEKKDWSKSGIPHPVLSAELFALVDVPFGVMNLLELQTAVRQELAT